MRQTPTSIVRRRCRCRDQLHPVCVGITVDFRMPLKPIFLHGPQGSVAGLSTLATPRIQSEASLPISGAILAISVAMIAPTTLYSVWDDRGVILHHPNHDAAMRIGGEAPRKRAHSLPRSLNHGGLRVTATSDRLGNASHRSEQRQTCRS
jgi:hypothetical protein